MSGKSERGSRLPSRNSSDDATQRRDVPSPQRGAYADTDVSFTPACSCGCFEALKLGGDFVVVRCFGNDPTKRRARR